MKPCLFIQYLLEKQLLGNTLWMRSLEAIFSVYRTVNGNVLSIGAPGILAELIHLSLCKRDNGMLELTGFYVDVTVADSR